MAEVYSEEHVTDVMNALSLKGMRAKGKNDRGVQRGACKGCNECIEFKGDARCDYCNCAATQHTNLVHGSSNLDTSASASKMGNVQESKGKDGRGVQRGACNGCNECSEFKGDARCDYCNCAASQHTNLVHGPSNLDTSASASKMGNVHESKGKDGRGIKRGNCLGCTECLEFRGDVRCDYCNCTATQHVNLTHQPTEKYRQSTFSRDASENARGKDRQGIWRGKCNSCTECSGFTGDARCDYCNCAATQHLNLTQLPSKNATPSPPSKGALNNANGKDGRGVKRGKCSGCTECYEFRGDVRCDYCNCAATQHFNFTHPSSSIDTSGHLPRTSQPGIDSRGVRRERCTRCKECSIFSGSDRCDYCNCSATEHIKDTDHLKLTDPKSNTDIAIDRSNDDLIHKVYPSKKSFINNLTQDHILRIRVRPRSEQPDGVSQTVLQQRFNDSIHNKKSQIEKVVKKVFGAEFKDIRFENGSIIINIWIYGLEIDAEITLRERQDRIENYAKSLVRDIFSSQFMNLNEIQNQTLEIDMIGIFT
ncbi:hypothetical protein ACJMK2_044395, partial [Sinanodonta woodiana]